MIKLRRDYSKRPPGGDHYPDPSGVTIKGKDVDDLLKNITAYRLKNSLPWGSPELEVAIYYCEIFPGGVEHNPAEREGDAHFEWRPVDYMERWVNKLWLHAHNRLVGAEAIDGRTATCRRCPFHRVWEADLDLASQVSIHRKLWILSQGNLPAGVGYCSFHERHAGLLCMLEQPNFVKETPACWQNQAVSST
jgi:hypothetical protein